MKTQAKKFFSGTFWKNLAEKLRFFGARPPHNSCILAPTSSLEKFQCPLQKK